MYKIRIIYFIFNRSNNQLEKKYIMDAINRKILIELQRNSNLKIKEIANKVGLSVTPVYERIKKMEMDGIISKYCAVLNYEKLGKKIIVLINITIKEHTQVKRNEFVERLNTLNLISEIYHTSGAYDFMLKIRISSIEEYKNFLVNELSTLPNINDIESQIVLEEIKFTSDIHLD